MPDPTSAPRPAGRSLCVDLLGGGDTMAGHLQSALSAEGGELRRFDRAEQWVETVRQRVPDAVMVQASLSTAIAELLSKLNLSGVATGNVLLAAFGRPKERLDALIGGSDMIGKGQFDTLAQRMKALAQHSARFLVALLQTQKVVGQVERDHDGDTLGADHFAAGSQFLHALIQISRRRQKTFFLAGLAGDSEVLIKDAYRDGLRLVAHVPDSRDLRRLIMASTRLFADSVFSMSAARSATRVS